MSEPLALTDRTAHFFSYFFSCCLSLFLLFTLGCHPRGSAHPQADVGDPLPTDTVDAPPVRLLDLLKPEFREVLPASFEVDWHNDTTEIGEGTCILTRHDPFFRTLRRPNTWLSEIYRTRLEAFVETCEESASDPSYSGQGNEGFFAAEISRRDANLVSMCVEVGFENPGGRALTEVHSLNLRPNSGTEYTVYDLFTIPEDSVNRLLRRLVVPRIHDLVPQDQVEEAVYDFGGNSLSEVYGTFVLDSAALTIVLHGGIGSRWLGPPDYVALPLDLAVDGGQ